MPSRILRAGFVDSEAVCALSDWAHRVYSNLIPTVDDAGRYDARLEILRSHLFPLGTLRRSPEVEKALAECESHQLLVRYHFAGKPYLQLTRWHRAGSALRSKFPWRDGSIEIKYVTLATKDGPKEFVFSSVEAFETPSRPPPDPLPRGPNSVCRIANSELQRGSEEGESPPRRPHGPGFPETIDDALRQCDTLAVPKPFVMECFDLAKGRGGKDWKQIEIADFPAHVRYCWTKEQARQNEQKLTAAGSGAGGATSAPANGAMVVAWNDELRRVDAEMAKIRAGYEGHQDLRPDDRKRMRVLLSSRSDLRKKIGLDQ